MPSCAGVGSLWRPLWGLRRTSLGAGHAERDAALPPRGCAARRSERGPRHADRVRYAHPHVREPGRTVAGNLPPCSRSQPYVTGSTDLLPMWYSSHFLLGGRRDGLSRHVPSSHEVGLGDKRTRRTSRTCIRIATDRQRGASPRAPTDCTLSPTSPPSSSRPFFSPADPSSLTFILHIRHALARSTSPSTHAQASRALSHQRAARLPQARNVARWIARAATRSRRCTQRARAGARAPLRGPSALSQGAAWSRASEWRTRARNCASAPLAGAKLAGAASFAARDEGRLSYSLLYRSVYTVPASGGSPRHRTADLASTRAAAASHRGRRGAAVGAAAVALGRRGGRRGGRGRRDGRRLCPLRARSAVLLLVLAGEGAPLLAELLGDGRRP